MSEIVNIDVHGEVQPKTQLTGIIKSKAISGSIRSEAISGSIFETFLRGEKGDKGDTGEKGEKGDKGDKGDTPVRGVDYWTAEDISSMTGEVIEAVLRVYPVAERMYW